MLLEGLIIFILGIALMGAICYGIVYLFRLSLTYSKAVLALFIAFVFHTKIPLCANVYASAGIWAAICLAVCFALCILPRVDCAFEFFSKSVIAYIFGVAALTVVSDGILGIELSGGWKVATDIAMKAVALGATGWSVAQRFRKMDFGKFKNVVVVNMDRGIASFFYAFAGVAVLMSNLPISVGGLVNTLVLLGLGAGAFYLDYRFNR